MPHHVRNWLRAVTRSGLVKSAGVVNDHAWRTLNYFPMHSRLRRLPAVFSELAPALTHSAIIHISSIGGLCKHGVVSQPNVSFAHFVGHDRQHDHCVKFENGVVLPFRVKSRMCSGDIQGKDREKEMATEMGQTGHNGRMEKRKTHEALAGGRLSLMTALPSLKPTTT